MNALATTSIDGDLKAKKALEAGKLFSKPQLHPQINPKEP